MRYLKLKNRKMKKYSLILVISLLVGSVLAQGIDEQRMDKDLKVAQTVLNSLVNDNRSMQWSGNSNDKQAQYIADYGVILSLPKSNLFYYETPSGPRVPGISNAIAKSFEVIEDISIDLSEEEIDDEMRAEMEKERAERRKELALRQAELEKRAALALERAQIKIYQMDSMREQKVLDQTENVIDFLLDYGHLISQLKDSDKILVMEKGRDVMFYTNAGRVDRMKSNSLSIEAQVKDLKAFQAGKIDRAEAKSRIVVNEKKEVKPLAKDLALFQTIIKRLYQQDLSDTYYLSSDMPYEQIEGLGVIFYLNMVSSFRSGSALWNVPTANKTELSQQERDQLIKEMYPKFESDLIKNILDYGKTISSLANKEQLIFKVSITKCADCQIPESLELQISGKVLKDLNSNQINLAQATKMVKVNKGELQ